MKKRDNAIEKDSENSPAKHVLLDESVCPGVCLSDNEPSEKLILSTSVKVCTRTNLPALSLICAIIVPCNATISPVEPDQEKKTIV